VSQLITAAYVQLTKIAADLNYLGLGDDHYPVQRFKYLQAAANFLADQAIQAERTFIQFRTTAEQQKLEQQKLERLQLENAAVRLEGAQEVLDYTEDRTFDEDLWFRLAGELQDLARGYLDMAIHAAFLMQRAYDLEFDRDLQVIRLDYGVGADTEGLLGGDYLKRDIASFTLDYLEHAVKQNPMRLLVSLRTEFPQAFNTFQEQGILPFRTDLEIFDRRYPGSYRRKLKRIEVFVEGLVPPEGVHGTLQHTGVSTEWRRIGGVCQKHTRALPAERMVLSSYQFRREVVVFQPSEELLGLFENLGPQGDWTLEVPRSGNDLDYQSISDVKLAMYFDTAHARERIEYEHDGDGNVVREHRRGEWSDRAGAPHVDELVVETTYAAHPTHGTTSLPCRIRKLDGAGRMLKSIDFFYDGPAFTGLPFGELASGFRTRTSYNAFGEILEVHRRGADPARPTETY